MNECSHIFQNFRVTFLAWLWALYDYSQSYFGQDILWNITQTSDISNMWELNFLDLYAWFVIRVIEFCSSFCHKLQTHFPYILNRYDSL